jgi:hypothetical protein
MPEQEKQLGQQRESTLEEQQPHGKVGFYGPWIGEFGWELMAWQAWCRLNARNFEKVYVCSFPDMAPLYEDFATFIPHDYKKRHLDWTDTSNVEIQIPTDVTQVVDPFKKYKLPGQHFIPFGTKNPMQAIMPRIIIHARGINKGGKNYPIDRWEQLVAGMGAYAASVGTEADHHIKGTEDLRDLPLSTLMDELTNARMVIGQSSGVMHLAALCGAPLVVWGDPKTYFGEGLDVRYRKTWNPFKVPTCFIGEDNWNPDPRLILKAVQTYGAYKAEQEAIEGEKNQVQVQVAEDMAAERSPMGVPVPDNYKKNLMQAVKSKKYMATIHWQDASGKVKHYWITRNFPRNEMLPSMDHIVKDMLAGGVKKKKVIHAAVEREGYITPEPPDEEGIPQENEAQDNQENRDPSQWT